MSGSRSDPSAVATLKERGLKTWEAAIVHPMVLEIGAGSLPYETFKFYFEQNIMYLDEYARSIALIASKAPDTAALTILNRFLAQITEKEIPANHRFLERLGGMPHSDPLSQMTAANYSYTRHLLYTASRFSPAAGLAAVLPCQWSYGEIGGRLAQDAPEDPLYADWIELFANSEYDVLVGDSVALLDRLAAEECASIDQLSTLFDWSTHYELEFWEMAYSNAPVGGAPAAEADDERTMPEMAPRKAEEDL